MRRNFQIAIGLLWLAPVVRGPPVLAGVESPAAECRDSLCPQTDSPTAPSRSD